MKKVSYGLGLLASAMFAVTIAHAQTGGGSGGAGASGAGSSASAGAAGTGTAGGTTGAGPAGSSGVGASSPSNLNTGGAGATGTGAGAAGTRATGAGVGTGAAGAGFSTQGTGAGGAAATPGGFGTTQARASAGAAGVQSAQPGGTGVGAAGTPGRFGTPGTTGAASGIGTPGAADARTGTTFDTQRNLGVQGDFNQRSSAQQQLLLDQQRAAGLRTQQGDFNRGHSQFSDQTMLQQRSDLTEQQVVDPQDRLRTDATLRGEGIAGDATMQSDVRSTGAAGAPGELGVFVSDTADRGVLISRVVDGSAADLAGLRAGDVILGVGGEIITAPGELTRMIRSIPAGEVATLQVIRDGSEYDVDATLMAIRDRSVAVGYRGTPAATSGDLAARVRRLEEQLDMVINELREMRREVVMLREPGGVGVEARYGERETGTTIDGEFGTRSTIETGAEVEQRETQRGIGVGTEFDQRSTERGIGTDLDARGAGAGFDAQSRTQTDAGQIDRGAAGQVPPQTPDANDNPLGLNETGAAQDVDQPATEEQQDEEAATDADDGLPF